MIKKLLLTIIVLMNVACMAQSSHAITKKQKDKLVVSAGLFTIGSTMIVCKMATNMKANATLMKREGVGCLIMAGLITVSIKF